MEVKEPEPKSQGIGGGKPVISARAGKPWSERGEMRVEVEEKIPLAIEDHANKPLNRKPLDCVLRSRVQEQ